MLEQALVGAGKAVVTRAAAGWLADRSAERQRTADLSELVRRRVTDVFGRRTLARQLEAIADDVARRLEPLCEREFRDLAEGEKQAALDAVVRTFEVADLSDKGLFAADADPAKLATHLRSVAGPALVGAGLGEAGTEFFHLVLADCAACFVAIVVALPAFDARASVETLRRLSALDGGISEVLSRLPRPRLDAPAGTGLDEGFRRRYLAQVGAELDVLEMPGLTTRRYRPRTTLTVAYLSLTVTTRDRAGARADRRHGTDRLSWLTSRELPGMQRRDHDGAVRVENALAGSSRMLIRGAAGSGKTTLVQWLAVTAARSGFQAELQGWNGHVPFLVRLREYAEGSLPAPEALVDTVAPMAAGLMPPAWAHRVLDAGKALLLVDGVDEVPEPRRAKVRDWLRQLLRSYPSARVVVTSRPAAAGRDWLRDLGFSAATVESMTPRDVRTFVSRWHAAAADAAKVVDALPCPLAELPEHERRLLAQLDNEPHLRMLATNPLLCAMLCALNLDRRSHLPRDRIGLYNAALDMMLERRDAERDVAVDRDLRLDARDKTTVLRALAWWLSNEGRAEMPADRAVRVIGAALSTVPTATAPAEAVLRHLLTRSGLIREPIPGRIDFVHRTFQEYLTAQEAADRGHSGFLVARAHLDQWRETIVMAAGHGDNAFREELLDGLDSRAQSEPRYARQFHLLAVSCLETMPAMDEERQDRVAAGLAQLLPPRRAVEARSLVAAGPRVLHGLPDSLVDLTPAAAAATVRTAALIHGPEALSTLARYGTDPRYLVQQELIRAWEYFDPEEYACRVLADSPLDDGKLRLTSRAVLPGLPYLHHLTELSLELNDDHVTDLSWLRDVPHLHGLRLVAPRLETLGDLAVHTELRWLNISTATTINLAEAGELARLENLYLWPSKLVGRFDVLRGLTDLQGLGVQSPVSDPGCEILTTLPKLKGLYLYGMQPPALELLKWIPKLAALYLASPPGDFTLGAVARMLPRITRLGLYDCPHVDDLAPVADMRFAELELGNSTVSDLTPLANHRSLQCLVLYGSRIHRIDALAKHGR